MLRWCCIAARPLPQLPASHTQLEALHYHALQSHIRCLCQICLMKCARVPHVKMCSSIQIGRHVIATLHERRTDEGDLSTICLNSEDHLQPPQNIQATVISRRSQTFEQMRQNDLCFLVLLMVRKWFWWNHFHIKFKRVDILYKPLQRKQSADL